MRGISGGCWRRCRKALPMVEPAAVATIRAMHRRLTTLVFLLSAALLAGCSHPEGKATVIAPPPASETVTVDLTADLGILEPHTAPLLRPTSANLPEALLAPLRPILTDPMPTLITLGETVKFDGRFPGDKKD